MAVFGRDRSRASTRRSTVGSRSPSHDYQWPEVGDDLAELDDAEFERAIARGRRRHAGV